MQTRARAGWLSPRGPFPGISAQTKVRREDFVKPTANVFAQRSRKSRWALPCLSSRRDST